MSIFGIQFNLMKIFTFIALTILPILCFSQKIQKKRILGDSLSLRQDAKKKALKNKSDSDEISIKDYVFFNHLRDSSFVDTTLTIHKDYKFNYLRKDNFNLISFGNLGQTYNTLSYDLTSPKLTPEFGARARHFNYMEIEDINYFSVPTPLTEIMYKTGFTQGQVLDALFSTNISRQFNFSIAYKGMRSLGKYQHTLTSTGNFRFTSNYFSKNSRYKMFGHVVMQDLMNEENGGLTQEGVENFTSGNEEFKDRSVFSPQFENAESMLRGRRYFLNHNYNLLNSKDSLSNSLEFGQKLLFEDKYFQYVQNAAKIDLFGESYSPKIDDKVTYEDFNTSLYVNYNNETFGKINLDLNYSNYNYGYNAILITDNKKLINKVNFCLKKQIKNLPKKKIASQSIKSFGLAIFTKKNNASNIINLIAPEHLEVCIKKPQSLLKKVNNAGSIFIGNYSPEAMGDYLAGTNHVLPTSGSAKFSSGLSVFDFLKRHSIIKISKSGIERLGASVINLAKYENLEGHANSIKIRLKKRK